MSLKFPAFLLSALCASSLLLSSCESQKPATTEPAATKAAATPAVQASYECPMGCEGSKSTKPGKCPTCGMDLEKKS